MGTLLYEMATGRKAFDGDSQASLIASILTAQPPPVSAARPNASDGVLPPALDHIVERCLAKGPADRWQTARDVALELEWTAKGSASVGAPPLGRAAAPWWRHVRTALGWAVALLAGVVVALVTTGTPRRPAAETTRFTIAPPPGTTIGLSQNRLRFALSPDGRRLAFVGWTGARTHIWVRSLDSLDARMLEATEGALQPFWSPDSRFVGFFADTAGELRKVDAAGGPATTICAAQSDGSVAWGRDGTILFTQFRDGIYRVSADGGTPVRVTTVDKSRREMNHYWPSFLSDGRRFLYMATSRDAKGARETPTVYVASLDAPSPKPIARMHSKMVQASDSHVLFVQDGALMAQAFDAVGLRLVGEAVRIADGVGYSKGLGNGAFDVSQTGVLAYQGSEEVTELLWYDRRGTATETGWPAQSFGSLRLSPDGQRVAVDVLDPRTGAMDIWVYEIARGAATRFTTDGFSREGVWAPDGRRLVFSTSRSQAPALVVKTFDEHEEPLVDENSPLYPDDWSKDGQWIAYRNSTRMSGADLFLLPLAAARTPQSYLRTTAHEWDARFSPDSRWVAFVSNELGQPDVYVSPIRGGGKTRVSTEGGTSPRWRRDGKELFYAAADNRSVMAVPVAGGEAFTPGIATRLFTMRSEAASRTGLRYTAYDVTPDGSRFLVERPGRGADGLTHCRGPRLGGGVESVAALGPRSRRA